MDLPVAARDTRRFLDVGERLLVPARAPLAAGRVGVLEVVPPYDERRTCPRPAAVLATLCVDLPDSDCPTM